MFNKDLIKENFKQKLDAAMKSENPNDIVNAFADFVFENTNNNGSVQEIEQSKVKEDFRAVKEAVLPGEKLCQSTVKMDIGKIVKGMAGKGWQEAEEERKYIQQMATSGNEVLIPQDMASKIIDNARATSAIMGRIPIVQMQHNNLTVAVQTKDAEASFVKEGDKIPNTEPIFEGVKLDGKTLAIYVPVSEKLLDSASNLSSQLESICSASIALALDKALLYGEGDDKDNIDKIKGISKYTGINKVSDENIGYDSLLKGLRIAKKSNILPTDICYSTSTGIDLSLSKDTTGQYIRKPEEIDKYIVSESNNITDTDVFIYNSNMLLLGMNKDISIAWGTVADDFQRLQKGLRIYLRADLAVLNEKAVTLISKENSVLDH